MSLTIDELRRNLVLNEAQKECLRANLTERCSELKREKLNLREFIRSKDSLINTLSRYCDLTFIV